MSEIFEHILPAKSTSWWKNRSSIEKCLIISTLILFVLLIVIMALKFQDSKYGSYDICFTQNCVKTASQILQRANLDVNPCNDFYNFACGNFVKNTFIPRDKSQINEFDTVSEKILEEMRILLEKPIAKEIKPFVQAKAFYQACMNISAIEANSLEKFKDILERSGGWPVLQPPNWNESNFNWISATYRLFDFGVDPNNALINFVIDNDITNSTRQALYLDQIDVAFKDIIRRGFDEPLVQKYYGYMVNVGQAFGGYKPTVVQEMREVIDFFIELVRITVKDEDRRNSTLENNPMTLGQLQDKFPYVPWLEYVNKMLEPYSKKTVDDVVYVKLPQYYQALGDLLQNTPKKTIANYFFWDLVSSYASYLNSEIRDYHLEYNKFVTGVVDETARWKKCTNDVARLHFVVASGAMYVQNYFKKETKLLIAEMVDEIQLQFRHTIETVQWMDNATRQHALDKMKNMNRLLAFPDELYDDQKLIDYYDTLQVNQSDYLQSVLNVNKFARKILYTQLDRAKPKKKDWMDHSYTTYAYAAYDRLSNNIEILAGILQGIFFQPDNPKYMNFGAIGYVIGHEITHGFDDLGRQYDKDGNLRDWWSSTTADIFTEKSHCFIQQLNDVTVPEVNLTLNGKNTQGEVIADNSGLKHAYSAYNKWAQDNAPEQILPGLSFNPQQLFWIAAANVYCSVQTKEHLASQIINDRHPPDYYRVNLALMNSMEFARDFHCGSGTPMNPQKKCTIW